VRRRNGTTERPPTQERGEKKEEERGGLAVRARNRDCGDNGTGLVPELASVSGG
jgi:hypothetical protein